MKFLLCFVVLSLLLLALVSSIASAEPPPQDINLLQNPGFENPYSQQCCHTEPGLAGQVYSEIQVAQGWTAWWVEPDSNPSFPGYCDYNIKPPSCQPYHRPEYGPAYPYSERIRSGSNAQKYFTFYSTHLAGLYQQITGVTPGQVYRFSIYAETWSTGENKGFTSSGQPSMGVQVGIDPNGGTDPFSPGIVWSQSQNAFDAWTQLGVDTAAQSSTITVFTRSWPQLALQHNDVYLDDASLSPTGAAAPLPTSPSLATAPFSPITAPPPPAVFITSTPLPNGEIWYTVQPGDTLGRIAYLFHTTIDQVKQLNSLKNNTIYSNQKLLVTVITPPPAVTPTLPAATATPAQVGAPTLAAPPTQPPLATALVAANYGQLCVVAYNDANRNAIDDNEPSLANVRVTLSVGVTPLDGYVTTGDESSHCFPQLPAGAYTVSVAAPAGYTSTTAAETTIQLKAQTLLTLAFGVTAVTQAPAPAAPAAQPLSSVTVLLIGVGGLSLITGSLGLAALAWLRKK